MTFEDTFGPPTEEEIAAAAREREEFQRLLAQISFKTAAEAKAAEKVSAERNTSEQPSEAYGLKCVIGRYVYTAKRLTEEIEEAAEISAASLMSYTVAFAELSQIAEDFERPFRAEDRE